MKALGLLYEAVENLIGFGHGSYCRTMSLVPLMAIAGASLALAGFDLSRKLLGRHLAPLPMVALLAAASVPLFAVPTLLGSSVEIHAAYIVPALGSVLLNLGAHLAFLGAVRLSSLSLTIPLLSLTPVFTAVAGLVLLGEWPTNAGLGGIVLVVLGTWWLHRPPETSESRRLIREPGAWLMIGAALLWAVSLPLDKLAVAHSNPAFHGLVLTAGISVGALLLLAARGELHELTGVHGAWGIFALALITSTLALGLQLVALQWQWVQVSLVETAKRGVGNLAAVLLGRSIFREPLSLAKVGAAVLMTVGVALLLL